MKRLKVLTKLQETHLQGFFISFFTVSVTPSINTPESSNDFIIFIISLLSLFEINEVNPFSAQTPAFLLTFLSNFSIKLFFALVHLLHLQGIALFIRDFFPKLPNPEPKDPLD